MLATVSGASLLYLQQAKFGKKPSGKRLERLKQSKNFVDGAFQNLSNTPALTEGYNYAKVASELMFNKKERRTPKQAIPNVKTNLINLPKHENVLVWFGHSSYFLQIEGISILVDPVFSGNASPIPGSVKSFKGADAYQVSDLPEIDLLLISHDHYDHLDYETIRQIKPKIKSIICGLGVGEHFEHWGYDAKIIHEKDWNEKVEINHKLIIYTAPARHFSGRSFKRNNTLWLSFILKTPTLNLYLGGDSGYDSHFAEIGEEFGPFDLAILENGQYDEKWKYIHMQPAEVLQASKDLGAKRLFPVHSSKFKLANHAWDEPLSKISQLNQNKETELVTPKIGELVNLSNPKQVFTAWWESIK